MAAAGMVSLSESLQTSMISQQKPNSEQKDQLPTKGVGFFVQVLLVAALFGIEMVIAFEQIYLILFHQFLGVPVSLLSINGIICGAVSMTFLPILGYFTDKGANPKRRKLCSLFVGMSMFLGGLVLLAIGGFIKLTSYDFIGQGRHVTNMSTPVTPTTYSTFSNVTIHELISDEPTSTRTPLTEFTSPTNITQTPSTEGGLQISSTAILSIIGFSFIDIGFDLSISITRAFILEHVPSFQHTRLLVMSTVAASMAGTTFSFIGCFDFPGTLGPIFHAEGVAVTLIFFCALLFCIVFAGYSSTVITGFILSRKPRKMDAVCASNGKLTSKSSIVSADNKIQSQSSTELCKEKVQTPVEQRVNRRYVPDILHTEEGDASTKPLLLEDSLRAKNYWAMSVSMSSICNNMDMNDTRFSSREFKTPDCIDQAPDDCNSCMQEIPGENSESAVRPDANNESKVGGKHKCKEQIPSNGECSFLEAVKMSCSLSMSIGHPPLGEFHTKKLENLRNTKLGDDKKEDTKLRMNKRLIILCCSCFFTFGGLITFIVYISNALNIAILHGDPTAMPGTEAYARYQEGLRTAAMGNTVLYLTYMIISINNTRLIKLIGEKVQFVVCHAFLIVSLLTLILTERVEIYFIFMVSCGALRTCVFTLPFVMATKFTQDETASGGDNPDKQSKNLGKVMSLIGFLIPAHYILVSAFMGPLMDSTGNVWVPLIYSLCSCSLSLVIFIPLFFVKN